MTMKAAEGGWNAAAGFFDLGTAVKKADLA
jgi:hypothetical protein